MTPQEIRETVVSIVFPVNPAPSFAAAQVDALADEAMSEMVFVAKPPSLRVTAKQNIVANQAEYKMPLDMLLPLSLRLYGNGEWGKLRKLTLEQLEEAMPNYDAEVSDAATGLQCYYESGVETTPGADYGKRKVTLSPTPTTNITNGLQSSYLRRPTKMSDVGSNEIVDIDPAHHFGIVYRVCYKLLLRQSTKIQKAVLENYDGLWKQALFNLKAHHSEAWLDDMQLSVGTWRGLGIDNPRRRS